MDQRERLNDDQEVYLLHSEAAASKLWTAMPAIVESYDAAKMTIKANVSIQMQVRSKDGTWQWVKIPPLLDVPVVFPSAGGYALTFPIAAGDEVLVVFAARCIDAWWQSGGVQLQAELRMHDLSDGFAIPGPRSQPRLLTAPSTNSVQLRNDAGTGYVEIAAGGVLNIHAPGGLNIVGDVNITGAVVASGEGTFQGTHTVSAHKHGGVTAGAAQTGTPTG